MKTARGRANVLRIYFCTSLMLALIGLMEREAGAQGVIVHPDFRMAALELREHRVSADVQDQAATVTVTHTFYNPGDRAVEGLFLFPLPPKAQVSRFSMHVDGREMPGEVLSADEARRIYEDIVRKSLDPALLELSAYQTFRARVFPIPPRTARTITLRYDATLSREGGTVTFQFPLRGSLSTSGRWGLEAGRASNSKAPPAVARTIEIEVAAGEPIRTVYSPSHEVDVRRSGARRARITYEGQDEPGGRDFLLYFGLDPNPIGATLLTHRPYGDRDGYFMLLLSPPVEAAAPEVEGKDVVFVLDVSGSMAGEKIEQARGALAYALNRLGSRDRFGIVAFSTEAERFRDRLMTTGAREDALYFVDRLEARGGTNINEALLAAFDLLEDSPTGQGMIVFLTDGLPSVGVQDEGRIRQNAGKANPGDVRLFSFGVGYDVNTRLLDGLAGASGAFAAYIAPEENIEEKVAAFYEKVRYPVLTGLTLDFGRIDARQRSPGRLPDLYRGGQLVLTGRYRAGGRATLTLTGRLSGEPRRFTYDVVFPARERDRDFVARLWATRRVGDLLDEIRLHGEHKELKEEVIALATEFGLVTPYTSYLVREEEELAAGNPGFSGRTEAARPLPTAPQQAFQASTGEEAVAMSKSIRAMKDAAVVGREASPGFLSVEHRLLARVQKDGSWVDAEYRPGMETVDFAFASDAFFTFLRLYPEASAFARLGDRVVFKFRDRFIRVGPDGTRNGEESAIRALVEH